MGKVAQAIQRFELMTRPSLGMAQGARKQREMPALLRETKSSVGNADWAASLPKDLRRYCSEWVAGIAEGLNVVRVSVADVRVERGSHATASYHTCCGRDFDGVRDTVHILDSDTARSNRHGGNISYSLFLLYPSALSQTH
jgi:hypothetical protein